MFENSSSFLFVASCCAMIALLLIWLSVSSSRTESSVRVGARAKPRITADEQEARVLALLPRG